MSFSKLFLLLICFTSQMYSQNKAPQSYTDCKMYFPLCADTLSFEQKIIGFSLSEVQKMEEVFLDTLLYKIGRDSLYFPQALEFEKEPICYLLNEYNFFVFAQKNKFKTFASLKKQLSNVLNNNYQLRLWYYPTFAKTEMLELHKENDKMFCSSFFVEKDTLILIEKRSLNNFEHIEKHLPKLLKLRSQTAFFGFKYQFLDGYRMILEVKQAEKHNILEFANIEVEEVRNENNRYLYDIWLNLKDVLAWNEHRKKVYEITNK